MSRWLVLPDLHLPYEDNKAVSAVLAFAADHRWDGTILLGDVMDCFVLSKFNEGKPRLTAGMTVAAEMDYANEWFDGFCKTVRGKNKKARIVYIQGNHEERLERFLDADPRFGQDLDIRKRLRLKERGIEWVEYWRRGDVFQLGHATFIHGFTTTMHHAAKTVRDYGSNVFYGHTHDVQEYPIRRRAKNVTIKGKSMGCLCSFDQPYMRGRPLNWQHAFGVFHFWPDGTFQEQTVHIHKGRFISPLDGKEYAG